MVEDKSLNRDVVMKIKPFKCARGQTGKVASFRPKSCVGSTPTGRTNGFMAELVDATV